jgi:hypothetical protein
MGEEGEREGKGEGRREGKGKGLPLHNQSWILINKIKRGQ